MKISNMRKTRVAYGEADKGIMEVLTRSVIRESLKPIKFLKVELELMQNLPVVSKVKEIRAYKAFATFSSMEGMVDAMSNSIGIL